MGQSVLPDTNVSVLSPVLSPVEQVFSASYAVISSLFYYSRPLDRERIEQGLKEAVARFPWVWSKFEPTADGQLRIVPRTDPVRLEEGSTDLSLGVKSRFVKPLETGLGAGLARFSVTNTPEGGVLGVRMSHAIADGASMYYFITSWAQLTRGLPIIPPTRVAVPCASGDVDDREAHRVLESCGLFMDDASAEVASDLLEEDVFVIPTDEIAALRARAEQEIGGKLSTNDVVMAHLWQKFGPDWCEEVGGEESIGACPVDLRALSGVPLNHFGCALSFAVQRLTPTQLRRASLGELAARLRGAVQAMDGSTLANLNRALESLRRRHGLSYIQRLHAKHPRGGILFTNMTRVPVALLDFGAGMPLDQQGDVAQYHGAAFFGHPEGLQVRLMPRPAGAPLPARKSCSSAA